VLDGVVCVPGTHVAIVPPPKFSLSATVAGFDHEDGEASLRINELPASPFDATDANLASGGYVVHSRERTARDGQSRQLFDGEQTSEDVTIGRMVLSIGSEETSALVIADYRLDAPELRDPLHAALESVVLDIQRAIEPGVAMAFEVTPADPLRLAGLLGPTAAYNTLGYLHRLDSLVPTMHIRPIDGDPPADPAAFLETQLDRMRQQLLPGISLPPVQTIIDGEPATQLVTTALDNLHDPDRRLFVYQVLLVHPDGERWVHMSAVATQAAQGELLPAFRATAESFRWR